MMGSELRLEQCQAQLKREFPVSMLREDSLMRCTPDNIYWITSMMCRVSRLAVSVLCLSLISITPVDAQDGFADGLTIPEGIEISEPVLFSTISNPKAQDAFRVGVLKAVVEEDSEDVTIIAKLPNLAASFKDKQSLLERYFASSPAWRVFEVRGARFATRRWKMADGWRYEMHGYYSAFDVNRGRRNEPDLPDFQTRCTLGFSNQPWVTNTGGATRMIAGQSSEVVLTERFGKYNSLCLISAGELLVEIFEQTPKKERSLTKATLDLIEDEAAKVAGANDWDGLAKSLPEGSIRRGQPEFQLCKTQPGVYDSVAWINAGEPGTTYLKAFEVTRGDQLSEGRLKRYANERIGWSDDPNELFFFNTHFTIVEGDWDQYYAGRFEVWFKPDSGKPERKLLERIYRVEGWMR